MKSAPPLKKKLNAPRVSMLQKLLNFCRFSVQKNVAIIMYHLTWRTTKNKKTLSRLEKVIVDLFVAIKVLNLPHFHNKSTTYTR